jgi:hypothetical protein
MPCGPAPDAEAASPPDAAATAARMPRSAQRAGCRRHLNNAPTCGVFREPAGAAQAAAALRADGAAAGRRGRRRPRRERMSGRSPARAVPRTLARTPMSGWYPLSSPSLVGVFVLGVLGAIQLRRASGHMGRGGRSEARNGPCHRASRTAPTVRDASPRTAPTLRRPCVGLPAPEPPGDLTDARGRVQGGLRRVHGGPPGPPGRLGTHRRPTVEWAVTPRSRHRRPIRSGRRRAGPGRGQGGGVARSAHTPRPPHPPPPAPDASRREPATCPAPGR